MGLRKADAPDYVPAAGQNKCSNCRFGGDGFCRLYEFNYNARYVCRSWANMNQRSLDFNDSVMVALFIDPDVGRKYALEHEGAIPTNDLHITLGYLGKVTDLKDDREEIEAGVAGWTVSQKPITAKFSGTGRFVNTEDDGLDAFYLTVDSEELQDFRADLMHRLTGFVKDEERDYAPHVTLTYLKRDEPAPVIEVDREELITFTNVYLDWGDELIAYPLGKVRNEENNMKPGFMRAFPDIGNRAEELLKNTSLPVPFVASTEGRKRDGFDLKAKDWDLTRYERYPVVLYGHDFAGHSSLPIGRGNARVEDSALKIDVQYDEDDEFAMKIRKKAIKGMMAGSVSWDTEKEGDDSRNVLIEFSNVNVGLDPDSLPELELARVRSLIGQPAYKDLIDQIREDAITAVREEEAPEEDEDGTYYIQFGNTRIKPENITFTSTSNSIAYRTLIDACGDGEGGNAPPAPLTKEAVREVVGEEMASFLTTFFDESGKEVEAILVKEIEVRINSPVLELDDERRERMVTRISEIIQEILDENVDPQGGENDDLDNNDMGEDGESQPEDEDNSDIWQAALLALEQKQ